MKKLLNVDSGAGAMTPLSARLISCHQGNGWHHGSRGRANQDDYGGYPGGHHHR